MDIFGTGAQPHSIAFGGVFLIITTKRQSLTQNNKFNDKHPLKCLQVPGGGARGVRKVSIDLRHFRMEDLPH